MAGELEVTGAQTLRLRRPPRRLLPGQQVDELGGTGGEPPLLVGVARAGPRRLLVADRRGRCRRPAAATAPDHRACRHRRPRHRTGRRSPEPPEPCPGRSGAGPAHGVAVHRDPARRAPTSAGPAPTPRLALRQVVGSPPSPGWAAFSLRRARQPTRRRGPPSPAPTRRRARRRRLSAGSSPAALGQPVRLRDLLDVDADHRLAEPARDLGDHVGVVVERGGLDDGLGALRPGCRT